MNLIETYNGSGLYAQYATSADYASNGQPLSSSLTAVPDTYLQNTDLTISDGKITEISGVPLSAGDEFPQSATDAIGYVTATSGDINSTINNVSANSGAWGGSALPVSAGPGVKIGLQNDTLVFSTDETVLWEGDATPTGTVTGTYSEPISNFERVRMYWRNNDAGSFKCAEYFNTNSLVYMGDVNPNLQWWKGISVLTDTTGFTNVHCWEMSLGSPTNAIEVNTYHFLKLVGINRIAGGD